MLKTPRFLAILDVLFATQITRSDINKHIKKMARSTTEEGGNHPGIRTQTFTEIARQPGFREVAPSQELRKQKGTARKRKRVSHYTVFNFLQDPVIML
jgi:hypothetical protein